MSRLVSSTVLHRHGSRGPGASELSPFPRDNPIYSQWQEHELEMLSLSGHSQIEVLGAWFARRYVLSGVLETSKEKTHWRSSKSDRALESGYDFVKGFNDAIGSQVAGPAPLPYDVDADNYFRPWKVFKKEANDIKNRVDSDNNWAVKAAENETFLKDIFQQVNSLDAMISKPTKSLWCTTYLHALREVENFWPNEVSPRNAFCQALSIETQSRVTELALWVWEQRFLHCGFNSEMGGRISVDLVESALNTEHTLNIFSGHDYTLLSVLAALNLVDKFSNPTGFGSYLLFELWETDGELTFKVIFNPDPFRCDDGHAVDMTRINENNEVVLKVCTISEIMSNVDRLRDEISRFPPPKPVESINSQPSESSVDLLS